MNLFTPSDSLKKLKTKLLILSSISLFIGINKTMPSEFTPLGLEFKDTSHLGWFLFWATLVMLLHFSSIFMLEFGRYITPKYLKKRKEKTTGDSLGLSKKEINETSCLQDHHLEELENPQGSINHELKSIEEKNEKLDNKYKTEFEVLYLVVTTSFEFVIPFGISIVGLYRLFSYLHII